MRQKTGVQQLLQPRHDHINIERDAQPQQQARQRANHAHQRALHHEDGHDAARAGPERAQNGDVGPLVGHRHHQGAHQIERRHRHDEGEDDEHHAFLQLHGGEPGFVLPRPVANEQVAAQARAQFTRHRAGLMQVLEFEPHTRGAFEAEDAGRVVHMQQGQRGVVFVMA